MVCLRVATTVCSTLSDTSDVVHELRAHMNEFVARMDDGQRVRDDDFMAALIQPFRDPRSVSSHLDHDCS